MSSRDGFDTRFSLPAIDDPPSTEAGVILMGLDAERLLAGLGVASIADDPALVTQLVDQIRHDALGGITVDGAVAAGAHRWLSARSALAAADPGQSNTAALRQVWARAERTLADAKLGELGLATRVYLAACWLRRDEVNRLVEEL